jgi:hypothetical protein
MNGGLVIHQFSRVKKRASKRAAQENRHEWVAAGFFVHKVD